MAPRVTDIRPLATMPEFAACEALQAAVWGFEERDLLPRRIFMVVHKIGGQVQGAFDGDRLVGFTLAMPGLAPAGPFWHSHMMAVDPAYRNQGLGRRLKLSQRDGALRRGLDLIEWTFDPLEIKNGYFNLEVLGVVVRSIHPNLYGLTTSALQAGLPTDRLTAEWRLRSPRVEQLAAGLPVPAPPARRRVEVPAKIADWKAAGDRRALAAQTRIREDLEAAFAASLVIVGYERLPDGGGAFLLAYDPGERA